MGPWVHGGWTPRRRRQLGDVSFNAKTAEFYRETDRVAVLRVFTSRARRSPSTPKAWVFETGTNVWRNVRDLAARRRQAASRSTSTPAASSAIDPPPTPRHDGAFDEYVSDPAKPVPYIDKIDIRHGAAST